MKFLKWTLIVLLTLTVVAILGGWLYLRTKTPEYSRELTLGGLREEVEVLYDEHGIPHIFAKNEADAYFALGFVHAQDRLFQMEMLRRLATGRLSEVVGDKALEVDKFFRTLSFREHTKRTLSELYSNPNDSAVIAARAYVSGINRFLEVGKTPLEFDVMGIPKTPFTLEDCLVTAAYMGFSFSEVFKSEPVLNLVAQKLGDDYLRDLVTGWDSAAVRIPVHAGSPVEAEAMLKLSSAFGRIEEFCRVLPPFHGSNSWIVGPKRTKSGRVLFENDTHIAFGQPSVWYEANLNYGDYSLYGNFIAGGPTAPLGHTQHGAWGLTMLENDDVDFYREQLNPANPNQVRFGEGWEDIVSRQEIIKVKGAPDVQITVRSTRHGYVVNDISKLLKTENQPITLWWTYYQRPDRSLYAFFNLAHARNVRDAERAASLVHAPGLNLMWGDAEDNIAWYAAGLLPLRPAGQRPYLPLDGASGRDEPLGWLPFEQNPRNVNPPEGFIFTANNQPDRFAGQPLLPGYYVPEDRARRIRQLLSGPKNDWTPDDFRRLALDHTNPVFPGVVQEIMPFLVKNSDSENEKRALEILKNWQGTHELTDLAPAIFYRWMYHFYRNAMLDELGDEAFKTFLSTHTLKRTFAVLVKNEKSRWWDDLSTPAALETRENIIVKSWESATSDLTAQLGNDPSDWQWQRVHTLTHKHPLGLLPGMGQFFDVGPFPVPGGKETVNNLDFGLDSTGLYPVRYGPALRRILDFRDRSQAMSVNPTGQSGNVRSRFYDDQAQLFATGQWRHEWTRREDVEKVKTERLVLKPGR